MTTIIETAVEAPAASPEALLKAAVSGSKPPESKVPESKAAAGAPTPTPVKAGRRFDAMTLGLAGAALAVGTVLGAGAAILAPSRSEGTGIVLAEISAALEANRLEASRLAIASDRLDKSVAALKDASEAARGEAKARNTALTDKVGKAETALLARIAVLGERIDQAEKDHGARLAAAAQAERHPAPVAAAAPPAPATKAEPVQTGSITEPKPKPLVLDTWAVRDVYDGTAMLEDRRRRLVEVTIGDAIPGIGRVEAVERRGREWIVVTRQGIITPQNW